MRQEWTGPPSRPLRPRNTGSPPISMGLGNGIRGHILIRWLPLIGLMPLQGGICLRPRGYKIDYTRNRDEGTDSSMRFRDSGGTRTFYIGRWMILVYQGTRGDDWSHPILKSCRIY